MQRFTFPIFSALTALVAGIAIGHYALPLQKTFPSSSKHAAASLSQPAAISPTSPLTSASSALSPIADSKDSGFDSSSKKNLIAELQSALAQTGSRRTYAAFSKLTDSIDEKNVHEVLAFAEGVSKPQDKSMLISLIVGRWAEFDPKAAIDYAQSAPLGSDRNRALTG